MKALLFLLCAIGSTAMRCDRLLVRRSSSVILRQQHLSSTSSEGGLGNPRRITVVGGGLAGLSTAYHLLNKAAPGSSVRIIDKAPVGTAGASAVAGGLLHPLSPRGKLIHWGLEGMEATNRLIDAACEHDDGFVLRHEIFRLALSPQNMEQFQATAERLPDICEWKTPEELPGGKDILGGLRLHNGCKVVHVPSYLQALWKACEKLADARGSTTSWSLARNAEGALPQDETVVYAAGSGLFQDGILSDLQLPVQLVRGQSLELKMPGPKEALLCGKYLSPLPDPDLVLLGATQEFKEEALSRDDVVRELRERTRQVFDWEPHQVRRLTSGTRVQSERGKYGRLPILGQLSNDKWIFTGLSSRGLVYHGVYGELLARAILQDSEVDMLTQCPDLHWWKSKMHTRQV